MTNLDDTQHDPIQERLAEMVEIQSHADDGSIHPRLADDLRDLTYFARDVLALAETAKQRPGLRLKHASIAAVPVNDIRDAAARHLGGQHE